MKRIFSVVLAALLAGVVIILFLKINRGSRPAQQEVPGSKTSNSISASSPAKIGSLQQSTNASSLAAVAVTPPASSSTKPEEVAARAGERVEAGNEELHLPPETVLQNVRRAVHQYGDMFGGNPVGTNPEITAALTGTNPKHINFLNGQPGMRINQIGELVDAWGTPYFFHQLSGTVMEIHSAGPDKIMWTADDLVTK
ncbi:MAG TPA: hypothetical protein VFB72_20395 [Verrucomicrobiae bacterium]|nr:hypothetical protein [Verrucomicrobiae bacterium]